MNARASPLERMSKISRNPRNASASMRAPAGDVSLTSPAGARMEAEAFRGFLEIFDMRSNGEARAFMHRLYHRPPWYAPIVASAVRPLFARRGARDVIEGAAAESLFSPEELGALPMPIHLLWGKCDRLLPRENFEFYRRSLPAHTIVEEPANFGHCPHFDDPEAYASRIVEFARGV